MTVIVGIKRQSMRRSSCFSSITICSSLRSRSLSNLDWMAAGDTSSEVIATSTFSAGSVAVFESVVMMGRSTSSLWCRHNKKSFSLKRSVVFFCKLQLPYIRLDGPSEAVQNLPLALALVGATHVAFTRAHGSPHGVLVWRAAARRMLSTGQAEFLGRVIASWQSCRWRVVRSHGI